MKGSTVLSENMLTGFSIVISFILMAFVVRSVLSFQADRNYVNLFESIARDIALIIDREAAMPGEQKSEYRLPEGINVDIRIDYKSVFVTYGDQTVKKSFSGMLHPDPKSGWFAYRFENPKALCFVKEGLDIYIHDKPCNQVV